MTTIDLEQVNRERRRKGLPPLSRDQAYGAMRQRGVDVVRNPSHDDGFDTTGFLIGYMTGIPMPSAGGIVGAMMHPSSAPSPSSDDTPSGGGSYAGGGASSSWDSGSSSSSSSDSSSPSSSSSDSGSSSSGGGSD